MSILEFAYEYMHGPILPLVQRCQDEYCLFQDGFYITSAVKGQTVLHRRSLGLDSLSWVFVPSVTSEYYSGVDTKVSVALML